MRDVFWVCRHHRECIAEADPGTERRSSRGRASIHRGNSPWIEERRATRDERRQDAGAGILWLAYVVIVRPRMREIDTSALAPDLVLAAGFLALPVVTLALSLVTGAFDPRYPIGE